MFKHDEAIHFDGSKVSNTNTSQGLKSSYLSDKKTNKMIQTYN